MTTEAATPTLDTNLGFTDDWFAKTTAAESAEFERHPFGDYTWSIEELTITPAKNATKPHNMLVVTVRSIAVAGDGDPAAVGKTMTCRYGTPGDPDAGGSPALMQQRTKQLIQAVGLSANFTGRALIGRQFDGTVTWKIQEYNGKPRVQANLEYERPVGGKRPVKAPNPAQASDAAVKWLAAQAHSDEGASNVEETPAWEQSSTSSTAAPVIAQAPTPPNPATASAGTTASNAAAANTTAAYLAETAIPVNLRASVSAFRAHITMGTPKAAVARADLIKRRIDPEGPIEVDLLQPDLKPQYVDWQAKNATTPPADEMMSLDTVPDTTAAPPTAQPAPTTPPAMPKATTGTRSKAA